MSVRYGATPEELKRRKYAQQKAWRLRNKERCRQNNKAWRAKNAESIRLKKILYDIENSERISQKKQEYAQRPEVKERNRIRGVQRNRRVKANFTHELYELTLKLQNGLCAICTRELDKISRFSRHADHDHRTGKPRGILCGPCNMGIGMFRDNISLLEKAIQYILHPPLELL